MIKLWDKNFKWFVFLHFLTTIIDQNSTIFLQIGYYRFWRSNAGIFLQMRCLTILWYNYVWIFKKFAEYLQNICRILHHFWWTYSQNRFLIIFIHYFEFNWGISRFLPKKKSLVLLFINKNRNFDQNLYILLID